MVEELVRWVGGGVIGTIHSFSGLSFLIPQHIVLCSRTSVLLLNIQMKAHCPHVIYHRGAGVLFGAWAEDYCTYF